MSNQSIVSSLVQRIFVCKVFALNDVDHVSLLDGISDPFKAKLLDHEFELIGFKDESFFGKTLISLAVYVDPEHEIIVECCPWKAERFGVVYEPDVEGVLYGLLSVGDENQIFSTGDSRSSFEVNLANHLEKIRGLGSLRVLDSIEGVRSLRNNGRTPESGLNIDKKRPRGFANGVF